MSQAQLTVREAGGQDGSGPTARLPEPVRRSLGVLSGDTVIVQGEQAAVATVWPGESGQSDDAVILDRGTRSRTGVQPGGTVTVRAERVPDAASVTVDATSAGGAARSAIRDTLRDRPVTAGDTLTVDGRPATVLDTRPDGPVRVTDETAITIRATEPAEKPSEEQIDRTTYDDIGGLAEELSLVREMVELPLAEPELFDRLGIDPPTGVLLHGPPGTGKTLIAEAVANAVDATFFHVSGPEITSKYKGESEERLREIFDQAREAAPAIVFFDEIDALAAKREGSDMETRIVAQLLSLMDGLETRGDVVVIGATNRSDAIDPALRRPGRFDREIEIGVPDQAGRRKILGIHTRAVPLAEDVDLDRLAARTHGFVGADCKALITEAAMAALRRSREAGTDELRVTKADIEVALSAVDPSAMREFVAETPTTGFDDIGGLGDAKAALREAIEWPLAYPRLFEETGTEPPTGILLYGPPGTGKTLLARAIGHETEVNVIHVQGPELIDKYVGESEKAVREVFERARQAAPSIVFFDEIDAVAARRGEGHEVTERVVSQLLSELDGVIDNPNVVVLAATNRKEVLDPALLRPGRLEDHIEVPLPDREARRAILEVHTRDKPLDEAIDLDDIAASLEGATGADLAGVVRGAAMRAIREAVRERGPATANETAEEIRIEDRHFDAAVADRQP